MGGEEAARAQRAPSACTLGGKMTENEVVFLYGLLTGDDGDPLNFIIFPNRTAPCLREAAATWRGLPCCPAAPL